MRAEEETSKDTRRISKQMALQKEYTERRGILGVQNTLRTEMRKDFQIGKGVAWSSRA